MTGNTTKYSAYCEEKHCCEKIEKDEWSYDRETFTAYARGRGWYIDGKMALCPKHNKSNGAGDGMREKKASNALSWMALSISAVTLLIVILCLL